MVAWSRKSLILRVFFEGVLGKVVCWRWYFAGELVVKCVINVVGRRCFFRAKNLPLFSTLFSGLGFLLALPLTERTKDEIQGSFTPFRMTASTG
jgi:hypothetical protein